MLIYFYLGYNTDVINIISATSACSTLIYVSCMAYGLKILGVLYTHVPQADRNALTHAKRIQNYIKITE